MGVKQIFKYCDDCAKVVRTDIPECVHYGAYKMARNSESVTVVYQSKDGKTSIPWDPDNPKVVAQAKKAGMVRVEYRGAAGERRLGKMLDVQDYDKHQASEERKARFQEPINKVVRENLLHRMRNARHPFEKSLAQAALDRMERSYSTNYDAGNHRS